MDLHVRFLLIIPIVCVALGAIGYGLCLAGGFDPHVREMVLAGGIATVAAMAGLAPLLATRGGTKAGVVQAGLLGTVIQMFLALVMAFGVLITHLTPDTLPFSVWLLAFYWATLAAVAAGIISQLHRTRVDEPKSSPAAGPAPVPH